MTERGRAEPEVGPRLTRPSGSTPFPGFPPFCHSRSPSLCHSRRFLAGIQSKKTQKGQRKAGKPEEARKGQKETRAGQRGREDMQGSLSVIPDVVYRESSITGVVMQPRASPLCAALRRVTGSFNNENPGLPRSSMDSR